MSIESEELGCLWVKKVDAVLAAKTPQCGEPCIQNPQGLALAFPGFCLVLYFQSESLARDRVKSCNAQFGMHVVPCRLQALNALLFPVTTGDDAAAQANPQLMFVNSGCISALLEAVKAANNAHANGKHLTLCLSSSSLCGGI